jgi:uncharacterized protein
MPLELEAFVQRFNQGAYWDSHEVLEAAWRRNRSQFYHGLILYASAWVHWQRGNRHGVLAQLDKAEPLLRERGAGYLGVDLAALLRDLVALRAGEDFSDRRPTIELSPALCAGTEPELDPAD